MECVIDGCAKKRYCKLMCTQHYNRLLKFGDPLAPDHKLRNRAPKHASASDRWEYFTLKTDTCWLWAGPKDRNGYGVLNFENKRFVAHRWGYEQAHGAVPKILDMDHLCRVRACVNPEHLEPVTRRVNLLRGIGLTAINAAKMQCLNGHEYTPENTVYQGGGRTCRECRKARDRKRNKTRKRIAA